MKIFLRFVGWATLTFILTWFIAHPYQSLISDLAGRAAAPPGSHIEWDDIETYYPYDVSVFVALCLASAWVPWRARFKALGMGCLVLIALEFLTLTVGVMVLIPTLEQPPEQAEPTQRAVLGVIRISGLVAAGCAWIFLLGWQRIPQLAAGLAARSEAARGGKR